MSGTLVTGGTGFLGGALLERVALDPEFQPVRALVRDRTGAQTLEAAGARAVLGDALEPDSLREAMAGCDLVFNLAGVNEYCLRDTMPMFMVNVTGAVNVVEAAAAAGVERVVHTSSASTIGEAPGAVGAESTEHRGYYLSAYARSKREGELAALAAGRRSGIEVVSVNPTSVQGPGRSTGTAQLLIDYLEGRMKAAVDTRVSLLDVADCAEGHVLAARRGEAGRRYVLSPPWAWLVEILAMVDEITGLEQRVRWLPRWLAKPLLFTVGTVAQVTRPHPPICREMVRILLHGNAYDGSPAARELGVVYRPMAATLRRAIEWYADYGFVRRSLPNFPR